MEDIEAINEMFPDELLTDAEFEKALDALCANPDENFKREITELMSEHQIITWEEAEQILGDTGNEPVKSSLPQQTRPTEPDNDTNVEETIQRLLQNDPGLVQINLNNMKRTPIPKIKRIIEAMRSSEFIQQLSLANMGLYDQDIAPLVELLEANESLRKLNLETNYLSGEFFAKLFSAANKNQSVEEIKAVNQGMNFSTQAERDIINAIKENHALTKISLNIRLPELRNKIQQVTMRNQEIRRILRKKAAEEERALAEQKRKEEEERERRKARIDELLKPKPKAPQKAPLGVFPKEMLHPKKKEPAAEEKPPAKAAAAEKNGVNGAAAKPTQPAAKKAEDLNGTVAPQKKVETQNSAAVEKPSGVAPMILADSSSERPADTAEPKKKKLVRKKIRSIAPKEDKEELTPDKVSKKPVLKKLSSLERAPKDEEAKPEPSKLENKEWPPRPREKTAMPKPEPKKSSMLTKWESVEKESVKPTTTLKADGLLKKTENSSSAKNGSAEPGTKLQAKSDSPSTKSRLLPKSSVESATSQAESADDTASVKSKEPTSAEKAPSKPEARTKPEAGTARKTLAPKSSVESESSPPSPLSAKAATSESEASTTAGAPKKKRIVKKIVRRKKKPEPDELPPEPPAKANGTLDAADLKILGFEGLDLSGPRAGRAEAESKPEAGSKPEATPEPRPAPVELPTSTASSRRTERAAAALSSSYDGDILKSRLSGYTARNHLPYSSGLNRYKSRF